MTSTPLAPDIGLLIQNDSGADIPAHSVVVVTSVELTTADNDTESISIHHVTKYTGQAGNILVTGMATIDSGQKGYAYSDQRIYVAIDGSVDKPTAGEQWGPVSGQWYISRKGAGFFADKHPSGDTYDRSIFYRSAPAPRWGKLASSMSVATIDAPTSTTVDIWERNYSSGSSPKPSAVTTHTELLALPVDNTWNIAGSTGLQVKIEFVENVWRISGVDCA